MALKARKEQDIAAAATRRYSVWLQTVFAAQNAAGMSAHIKAMSGEAISHTHDTLTTLQSRQAFHRWITLADPWQPDLQCLQFVGSLPDIHGSFGKASRRQVRCSPQLATFIGGHTRYVQPVIGPDPEGALRQLLRSCFVRADCMFKEACSPYQFLCRSQMIIDMAFVRAVLTASQWLGPHGMPIGYIGSWPPPAPATGL